IAICGAVLLGWAGIFPVLASSLLPGAQTLTNPLILSDPVSGAQAQMMPTTAWLAQNPPPYGSTASTASTSTSALPSPTCTLGTDNSPGDAQPLINSSAAQVDA